MACGLDRLAIPTSVAALLIACSGQNGTSIPGPAQRPNQQWVQRLADGDLINAPIMRTQLVRARHQTVFGNLTWNGGLVQNTPKIYLILWRFGDGGDPNKEGPYLERFLKGVGGSPWLNTVTQYYDSAGSIQNNPDELKGVWKDDVNPVPRHPTDQRIQQETLAAVSKFGYDTNATYIVATPHDHNTLTFYGGFCGYHSSAQSAQGPVAYVNFGYQPDSPGCGGNLVNPGKRGMLDGAALEVSYALAGAQTDPNPPTGWTTSNGYEIGDVCFGPFRNSQFKTGRFPAWSLWSNASNNCVLNGP